MQFDFDLSTVPVIKPIPDGTYLFRVLETKDRKAKSSGNDQVQFELEILAPKPVVVDGATVERHFHYLAVTPNTYSMVRDIFEVCGKLRPGVGLNTQDLWGSEFGAEVVKNVDERGQTRSNIVRMFKACDITPMFKETPA